ncbi:MAG: hypothetical protein ACI8WT_002990 [Clostridium sp.]|jgi:hypothetical protein
MQTKKGFILIYTTLVGIICLIIMMHVFDIQVSEVKYSTSSKRNILKEDNYQKQKEYLLTLFSTYIDDHKTEIAEDGVTEFFKKSTGDIVNYETSNVTYSDDKEEFSFTTYDQHRTTRNDYFKLEVIEGNIKMTFIRTKYIYKV